jgi:hypothetical protein
LSVTVEQPVSPVTSLAMLMIRSHSNVHRVDLILVLSLVRLVSSCIP